MRSFTLDSKNSEADFGLRVTYADSLAPTHKSFEELELEGKDGVLLLPRRYLSREFCVRLACRKDIALIERIALWLHAGKKLMLSHAPNRSYRVQKAEITKVADLTPSLAELECTFVLEPFSYSEPEATLSLEATHNNTVSFDLANPSDLQAYPLIRINAHIPSTLRINQEELRVYALDSEISIDSALMVIYDRGGRDISGDVVGAFPKLDAGFNHIELTGIARAEIEPRWRFL